jgi:hypothetical protein
MKRTRVFLPWIACAVVACADDGAAGKNSLVSTSEEAAGSNCSAGGLKVESGLDIDGDGKLEATEVTSTDYVCSGADGSDGSDGVDGVDGASASDITSTVTPATSEQCPSGGSQVQFGTSDGGPTGDPLVVCGTSLAVASAFGSTPVARSWRSDSDQGVTAGEGLAGTAVVISATVTTPRDGYIVAQGSSTVWCTPPGNNGPFGGPYGNCATPAGTTIAYATIVQSTSANQRGSSGEATSVAALPENTSSLINAAAQFRLPAGTYTFNLLGMADDLTPATPGTQVYYGGSQLTLFFVPAS